MTKYIYLCIMHGVSNSSVFGPFVLQQLQEKPDPAGSVRVCAKRFPQLSLEHSSDNSVFGTWNMELQMAHLLAVSDVWYLQNSASCFEIIVIVVRKTSFLEYRLLRIKDIENRRQPKVVPCWAAYFTYQTLNSLINNCCLKVMVHLKNRQFLME